MNWSGISTKTILGKLLRLMLKIVPSNLEMPILQGKLKGMRWIVKSGNNGCWLGSFEYEKQVLFDKLITKGSVVYDIGAHVGFYSLLASKLVGPYGKVYSFEPLQRNINFLREHIRINKIENITVIQAAVSDISEFVAFKEGKNSFEGRIVSDVNNSNIEGVAIDSLIASMKIPFANIIKMDIEGAEMKALIGSKQMLAEKHPTIFLSTHGKIKHEECISFLNTFDYNIYPLEKTSGKTIENTDEIIAIYKQTI